MLVDDHVLFRKGLASLLDAQPNIKVIGEASNGYEAVEFAKVLNPDLIMMDINMPKCDGLQATRSITQILPDTKIVMLTASDDDQYLFEAMKIGAMGYLLKDLELYQLLDLLNSIAKGEAILSSAMATKIFREFSRGNQTGNISVEEVEELTEREKTILIYVAQGLMNKEIADSLGISENTVKIHLRNILEKLHLRNRIQAAVYAVRQGIADQDIKSKP
ncbi:MAG: DNA-binding response regulator [Chloroflexi bacterium HGW-Chloroflexi-3]|nr:MAG: DNA-binding response regulator [Chloroflexi bacterium HGW-Chloroflexi-3]